MKSSLATSLALHVVGAALFLVAWRSAVRPVEQPTWVELASVRRVVQRRTAVIPTATPGATRTEVEPERVGEASAQEVVQQGNSLPRYPVEAVENGWEGQVRLSLTIDALGKVEQVELARSAGFDCLDRSAIEEATHWEFRNESYFGKRLEVPIQFILEDS